MSIKKSDAMRALSCSWLLKSRDDWKAKSHERKAQLKSAKIKILDLSVSRDLWRQRGEQRQEKNRQLQERLERTQRELEAIPARRD